jgi:hypothetical protein
LPYILPSQVFKALKIDIEYKASVMITGLLLLCFYSLEIWLFRQYISSDFFIPCYYSLAFSSQAMSQCIIGLKSNGLKE